jgi:hypothetical protein
MMSRQDNPQSHPNFDAPIKVVADPSLSRTRGSWLSPPARESGGEPTALAEVLHAKEALELLSTDFAYELVLKALEARRITAMAMPG